MSIKDFVLILNGGPLRQGPFSVPIIDATGLTGLYQLTFESYIGLATGPPTADNQGGSTMSGPNTAPITESLKKQGLKLDRRVAPIQKLIVDHIDKTPTEN